MRGVAPNDPYDDQLGDQRRVVSDLRIAVPA
jgi:hypothetical protein